MKEALNGFQDLQTFGCGDTFATNSIHHSVLPRNLAELRSRLRMAFVVNYFHGNDFHLSDVAIFVFQFKADILSEFPVNVYRYM